MALASVLLVGLVLVSSPAIAQGPPFDNFAAPFVLDGPTASVVVDNLDTTKEAGEPNHAGQAGGHSVWFRWTAPGDGMVTIGTQGTSFDTLLGVYTGSSVALLAPAASNEDQPNGTWSSATFRAVGGITYHVAVDGKNGGQGTITLSLTRSSDWSVAGLADLDGDGDDDVVWRNAYAGAHAAWLMQGGLIASTAEPPWTQ